jgi:RES domain-containing protein
MITRPFAPTLYRIHNPRWAYLPTSGAGAAKHGGRANRPGVEALYLSSDVDTALAEYQQAAPVLPPGTIVSYTVSLSKIADFSAG